MSPASWLLNLSVVATLAATLWLLSRGRNARAVLLRAWPIAAAGWIVEETCIRWYGWYSYSAVWGVFLDCVPLGVVLAWPLVILTAATLVEELGLSSPAARVIVCGCVVFLDGALIEPIAVHAQLWIWHGSAAWHAVPWWGVAGWGIFALAVRTAEEVVGRYRLTHWVQASMTVAAVILFSHVGLVGGWCLVVSHLPGTANYGTLVAAGLSMSTAVMALFLCGKSFKLSPASWLPRLPAVTFLGVSMCGNSPVTSLWIYTAALATPYLALCAAGGSLSCSRKGTWNSEWGRRALSMSPSVTRRAFVSTKLLATLVVCVGSMLGVARWLTSGAPLTSPELPGIVEIHETQLGSKLGGRVAEVRCAEGDVVDATAVLVVFEAPELAAQRAQWEARLKQVRAELGKAQTGPRTEELAAAAAGVSAAAARLRRLQAGPREEEIRRARNDVDAAREELSIARQEYVRSRDLLQRMVTTEAEHNSRQAAQRVAEARLASAQALLDQLEAGSREEEIAEARADFERVEAQHKLLQAGSRPEDVAVAEARVEEIEAKLHELQVLEHDSTVRAPGRGRIEVLSVRPGDLVRPGSPVVRFLPDDELWVRVFVPETMLGQIRVGQLARIRLDSPSDKSFTGEVRFISATSEFTPRNIQSLDERRQQMFSVRLYLHDADGAFKAGMAAFARFSDVPLPDH